MKENAEALVFTAKTLGEHWQAHRQLTRKVIEAFPEDKLFTYSVGGMRPFAALALEMVGMTIPGIYGLVHGKWTLPDDLARLGGDPAPKTKAELLALWDDITKTFDQLWQQIPAHRFQEVEAAFGQWKGELFRNIFYWIDNEIHHRAQGYVYLRSLGIEPPGFWDRDMKIMPVS